MIWAGLESFRLDGKERARLRARVDERRLEFDAARDEDRRASYKAALALLQARIELRDFEKGRQ